MSRLRLILCTLLLYGGLSQAEAATEAKEGEVLNYRVLPEVFAEVPNLPKRSIAGDAVDSVYLNALALARMEQMIADIQYRIDKQLSEKDN